MTETQPLEVHSHHSLLQCMVNASLQGIMLLQPVKIEAQVSDFYIVSANAAVENQLGIILNSAPPMLLSEVLPSCKTSGLFDLLLTAFETGIVQRAELPYKDFRIDGWFDWGVAPTAGYLVVTIANISQAKQMQQSLEYTVAQFNTIFDSAQSGMFLFRPVRDEQHTIVDFRFILANRALAAYVGQTPLGLTGELGSKWFPGYKTNGLFERYKETYETGHNNRFDFHYQDDGIDAWLDILATKVGHELLVTFTDFTPVKRLQLQLGDSVLELKRSNSYLEEFAYVASHDLQEPLRKIHFFANMLKSRLNSSVGGEESMLLQRMESSTNRMRVLIDDLLAYSRVSSKRNVFEMLNTKELVTEVLSDLETIIKEKNAHISVGQLPTLKGDKLQLRQLFQNLISNALKYSKPEVEPYISIYSKKVLGKEAGLPLPHADLNQEFYLIEIADNGLGFEQENALKIFQIFQRLHGRSEYPGTGVGLAIVQKVVENHKGYVVAEGKPGIGATFRVLLPA